MPRHESAREREVFRFLQPWQSSARAARLFRPISLLSAQDSPGSAPTGCDDTALASFAQIGALRINVHRCLITLFAREYEYVLSESTRTLSLQADATHDSHDSLWIGTASFPRDEGFSDLVITPWSEVKSRRPANQEPGYYHTDGITPHTFVVSDLRKHDHRLYPKFHDQIRFMCAVPLRSRQGTVIGAYLVLDSIPRYGVSEIELVFMEDMGESIVNHLEAKRALLQKQSAERLIKGLGVFSQGGDSLRQWWLDNYDREQERGRRQQKNQRDADDLTREQQADEELGESSKDANLRPVSAGALKSRKPEHVERDETTGVHDFGADRNSPPRTSSERCPEGSETFDIKESTADVFARASNLIRESMNVDGVLFLDAGFTHADARRQSKMSSDDGTSSADSRSSGPSDADIMSDISDLSDQSSAFFDKPDSGNTSPRKAPRRNVTTYNKLCTPLGFSTRTGSSLRDFEFPKQHWSLSQSKMERLLRRHPRGRVFNYQVDGTLHSASGTDDTSENTLSSDSGPKVKVAPRNGKAWRREREGQVLARVCRDARSIAFLPLWDPHREKWRAGVLVWSTTPGKFFSREEDLSYLGSFANTIAAELTRIDMRASEQAKTTFISSVSHELRSPLHGVLGATELLLESEMTNFQHDMAMSIRSAGSTLLSTIDAILDYTKINAAAPREAIDGTSTVELLDLGLLTENVIDTVLTGQRFYDEQQTPRPDDLNHQLGDSKAVQDTKDVQVILNIARRSTWQIQISPGTWSRILTNLVGNAIKYTKSGYVHVKLHTVNDNVVLAIQDTGAGISEDYQKHHLFTAFRQQDPLVNGTGLGLFIVKQLVSDLDGKIAIESNPEHTAGTKILVTFPAVFAHTGDLPLSRSIGSIDSKDRPLHVALYKPKHTKDVAQTHSEASRSRTRNDMLESSLRYTCVKWLHATYSTFEDADDLSRDVDVCFVLESDLDHWSQKNHHRHVLVLSEHYGPRQCSSDAEEGLSQGLFVDAPFGPRKLARMVSQVLDSNVQKSPSPLKMAYRKSRDLDNELAVNGVSKPSQTQTNGDLSPRSGQKLLLVDDNELNLKLLVAWSRKLEKTFVTASNGLEAVEAYTQDPSSFGLVLMDMSMPVMDGFTATKEIRTLESKKRLKRCKIVALTGVASNDARSNAAAAGVDVFLTKPASLQKLRELVTEMKA